MTDLSGKPHPNSLKPVNTFLRKLVLQHLARKIGENNNKKVPGGTLRMTPERIEQAEEKVTVILEDDGSVTSGGCVYSGSGDKKWDHAGWINYGGAPIEPDEIEWMEAIMYDYGLPWGG